MLSMGNHEAGVYFNHRVTIGDQRHGAPTLPDLTTSKLDDDDSTSIAVSHPVLFRNSY